MIKVITTYLLFLMFSSLVSPSLLAQTTQASILGRVINSDQKVQPSASVSVGNESTGFITKTLTNLQREFVFKELPLGGTYTITVSYTGYGEQKRSGYNLNQGDAIKVDINMQVSETTQEVFILFFTWN